MNRLKKALRWLILKGVLSLPRWAQRALEQSTLSAQGKGWGAATVIQEVEASLSLLPTSVRTRPVVLDIGANVGLWSEALLASAAGAHVFAFEPSRAAFDLLSQRLQGSPNIELVNLGVGKEPGNAMLWADQPGSGLGSLTRRRLDHFSIDFSHSEDVQIVTLDEWCQENQVRPDLIKLDVEGHELDVLHGAERTLRSVQVVQFEFGGCNIDTRTYFQDFFYFFKERGFRLMRLTPAGLVAVEAYREQDESFQTTNYFGVRTDEIRD